jgi:hypothetical protein
MLAPSAPSRPHFIVIQNPARTPKLLATGPRITDARSNALADQAALKLGDG